MDYAGNNDLGFVNHWEKIDIVWQKVICIVWKMFWSKYSIFYALCCLKYDTHNFCPFSLENSGNYFK